MKRQSTGFKQLREPLGFRTVHEIRGGKSKGKTNVTHRQTATAQAPRISTMEFAQAQAQLKVASERAYMAEVRQQVAKQAEEREQNEKETQ